MAPSVGGLDNTPGGGGEKGTPGNSWWRCAARFLKS